MQRWLRAEGRARAKAKTPDPGSLAEVKAAQQPPDCPCFESPAPNSSVVQMLHMVDVKEGSRVLIQVQLTQAPSTLRTGNRSAGSCFQVCSRPLLS